MTIPPRTTGQHSPAATRRRRLLGAVVAITTSAVVGATAASADTTPPTLPADDPGTSVTVTSTESSPSTSTPTTTTSTGAVPAPTTPAEPTTTSTGSAQPEPLAQPAPPVQPTPFAQPAPQSPAALATCTADHRDRILTRHRELGGAKGWLGAAVGMCEAVGEGAMRAFDGGTIFVDPALQAYALRAGVATAYLAAGGPASPLGFPVGESVAGPVAGSTTVWLAGGAVSTSSAGSFVVSAPMSDYWRARPGLGPITSRPYAYEGGTRQDTTAGMMFTNASAATVAVVGNLFQVMSAPGMGAALRAPLAEGQSAVSAVSGVEALVQRFAGGVAAFSTATTVGGHAVTGAIADYYLAKNGHAGMLGLPTRDMTPGRRSSWKQAFEGGTVYWTGATGAHGVSGALAEYHDSLGADSSYLGVPTSEMVTGGRSSWKQSFQGGTVYWTGATGAHAVSGAIAGYHGSLGADNSYLGVPTSEMVAGGRSSWKQSFQGGTVYWTGATGAHAVSGAIAEYHGSFGADNSYLGVPTSEMVSGGRSSWTQSFQGGSVYWSGATGAHGVSGGIAAHYASLGAENSSLGLPTGEIQGFSWGWSQRFQFGAIWYLRNGTRGHGPVPVINHAWVQQSTVHKGDWWRLLGTTNSPNVTISVVMTYGTSRSQTFTGRTDAAGRFDMAVPSYQGVVGTFAIEMGIFDPSLQSWNYTARYPVARVEPAAPAAYGRDGNGNPVNPQPMPYVPPSIQNIPTWQWNMMSIGSRRSWRPGCPAGLTALRRVEVPYWGFDNQWHRGWVTVRSDMVNTTVAAFTDMANRRVKLQRVEGVEMFGNSDIRSEYANNTSVHNCREADELMPGSNIWTDTHANGRAFDFNPVQNPWIRPGTSVWEPLTGTYWAASARRTVANEIYGVIARGGSIERWFVPRGFYWGANGTIDYMHFHVRSGLG